MSVPAEPVALVEELGFDETAIPGRYRVVARRFFSHKAAVAGLIAVVLLFLLAFVGPYLSHWHYTDHDFTAFREAPSSSHWFGTTQTGGDVYELTLRGMQKSLIIGLLVAVIATGLAALFGAFAGYMGGWTDRVLMWIVDLLLVLPSFLIIAILSPTFHGKTWLVLVILLAMFIWQVTARIVRGMTISLREREYILAARYMGVSGPRIIFRHVIPNVASLLIVDATINVSTAIILETGLSYFGFGVQPPDVSLGTIIADGTNDATTYWWLFWPAAILLVAIVLAVNVVGDGLRDAFDPTSREG